MHLFILALAGVFGVFCRYSANLFFAQISPSFPYGTITINVIGSFLIGSTHTFFMHSYISEPAKTYLSTGVLGAFTTFSALSLDAVLLLEAGHYFGFLFYLSSSVGGGVLSCVLGMGAARMVLRLVTIQ